ncbi:MAG TPA: hypothetical protein DCG75_15145 [Bacteroidales bacterium]|nr:hypothetical protein [Bacteroidales bacterium]
MAGEQVIDGTVITWTITDNSFNSAQCNYTVSIVDAENPTITCPANVSVLEDGGCSAVVNGLAPTTGDNCGVTLQTWTMAGATINAGVGDVSGETFNIGVTNVTYHIEDATGNFIECSFDVEVYDEVYGGLIDADQTICYNTTPNPFTDEDPATVCGGLTYQWQMKTGTGPWGDILGATNAIYTELTPLTEVTYYNRKAISDLTFGTAYSDTITITIQPEPTAFAGKDTTLCYGSPYQILDADTTNCDGVSWEILTGNGVISLPDVTKIDPVYTPAASDGGTTVELVLHASGKGLCGEATDTMRITYPSELLVSIGKPTPFYIDSTSTHINVYFKIESHRYIGDLGLYLVSPLDSVVELKTYCTGLLSAAQNITTRFYNDPYDTSTVYTGTISACTPLSGNYKFLGDWKKKLHGQDPANGAWRVRIGDNRNISGSDGFLREATVIFSDTNMVGIFESILLADSSINITINESPGGGDTVYTDRVLPITGLTTSCFDACDAAAVSTASGGIGPYTYAWNTSLDFTTPLFVQDSVYLCPGKYYVQATDSLGCTAIDSVTVGSPPEIKITNSTVVQNSCYGDSIGEVTLEFAGGTGALTYTYDTYTGAPKLSGETFDELKAGVYIFTITDGSSCTKDTIITINGPTRIDVSTIVTDITCYGVDNGQIEIIASGGTPAVIPPQYLYSIDSANTWFPGNIFTPLPQDTFYIAVQDSLGCIQFADTIEMIYPDTISIDSIKVVPTSCFGTGDDGEIIVYASGGVGALEYSTDNITFQVSNILTGLPLGDTTIYVRDNCMTQMLDSLVTITGPIPIAIDSVTVTDVNTCFGDNTGQITVYASGGTGNYEYSINGGIDYQTSRVFPNLYAGTYSIYVRDDDGCISPESIKEIFEPTELVIDGFTVLDASECNPDLTGSVTISASGGTGSLEYNVDGGAYQSSSTFTGISVGTHTFTVRDANLCVASDDATVSLLDPLTVSFNVTDIDCNGLSTGQITAIPSNGTPAYSYLWETGETTAAISGLSAGYYTVTITDLNIPVNCIVIDSAEVQQPEPLVIVPDVRPKRCITSSSRNLANSLGRIIVDPDGGTPGFTYEWTGPSGFTDDNDTIKNLQPGQYNLIITDSKNCKSYFSATIVEDNSFDILSFDVQLDDNSVCWYDSVRFTSTYSGNVDSIFMQVLDLETFIATSWFYDVNNVSPFRGRYKIEGNSDFERIRATNQYCKADTTHIIVDYFHDFELDIVDDFDGNALDDTIYLKGSNSGNLAATVLPIADISFAWTPIEKLSTPNTQATIVTPTESGFYQVIATSTDECADTSSIYLEFIPAITPNDGFSPNDDGINDYWKIKYIDKFQNNIVTVYSRWGVKVYEQKGYRNDDTSKSWDGKAKNGKDLPSGTYYYVIILNEEGFQPITGPITIIR